MSQTPPASPPFRWTTLLTPGALWMTLCIAGVFAAVVSLPIAPADFWWHLAAGERLLDGGGLLTADPYSFTAAGRPFVHQAWLAGLSFAALYRIGGLEALAVANALAFAFAYGLVAWRAVEASGNTRLAALAAGIGFAVSVENWTLRPQTFSVVLLSVTLVLVGRYADGRLRARWLLLLPPLTALWANLHGAFVLGIAILLATAAGLAVEPPLRRWAPMLVSGSAPVPSPLPVIAAAAASAAAACLTPWGAGIYAYVWTISSSPILRSFVLEWAPTDLNFFPGRVLAAVMALAFVTLVVSRRLPRPHELALLALVLAAALAAVRSVLWVGLPLAPVLARHLALSLGRWPSPWRPFGVPVPPPILGEGRRGTNATPPLLAMIPLACILLMAAAATPWGRVMLPLPSERRSVVTADTPVEAARALAALPPGRRTFHDMQYGSYLIWATAPRQPVFLDPRMELYPYEQWADYGTIAAGPEAAPLLSRYGIDTLMLDQRRQAGLIAAVEGDPAWEQIYADAAARIYRRK